MSESDLDEIEEFMDDNVEYGNISYIDLLYKIKDIREREYGDKISATALREFNFVGYLVDGENTHPYDNDCLNKLLNKNVGCFHFNKIYNGMSTSKWEVKMKELPND